MKIRLSTLAFLAVTASQAGGNIAPVEVVASVPVVEKEDILKASAQVRFGYIGYAYDNAKTPEDFASALGGQVKVETKEWNGLSLGAAFYSSNLVRDLSGETIDSERNYELASEDNHYNILSEAYIAYKSGSFNFKVGRQLIDTPYADSDDIRMTPNTFEGAVASYGMGNFTLIGAYLTRWQGPDAGTYEFTNLLGENADGVAMLAGIFTNDNIEAGLWYYGADKTADVFYADVTATYAVSEGLKLKGGLQYSNQSEKENSGIEGTLFGAMVEVGFSGFTLAGAYNTLDIDAGKEYFGGFGGGVGFVNMDEMTAGTFTVSQSGEGFKVGIAYDFSEVGFDGFAVSYDYGNFKGDIINEANEQNFILSYANGKTWDAELIYTSLEDVNQDFGENESDGGFSRVLTRINYNF